MSSIRVQEIELKEGGLQCLPNYVKLGYLVFIKIRRRLIQSMNALDDRCTGRMKNIIQGTQ